MKSAGMVALSVNPADMEALVSYVTSLAGTRPPLQRHARLPDLPHRHQPQRDHLRQPPLRNQSLKSEGSFGGFLAMTNASCRATHSEPAAIAGQSKASQMRWLSWDE